MQVLAGTNRQARSLFSSMTKRFGRLLFPLALSLASCAAPPASHAPNAIAPASDSIIVRREEVPNGVLQSNGLTVPRGFAVTKFAENLTNPRRIAIAPGGNAKNYDVFVSESQAGRVRVLHITNGHVESSNVFLAHLRQPYGLAFHRSGWLYIGETDKVVRVPYRQGQKTSAARPQMIAPLIADGYNNHWTRNLLFSPDQTKLFVTVGSSCNTCEENSPLRAAISVMKPDGSERRIFASGLRNPVGLAWRNDELWTIVNERDNLGDDVPPDYLTHVRDGGFYGWPYAYTTLDRTIKPDPSFGNLQPDKVRATIAPDVPVQAHSAALGVAFYPAKDALQVLAAGFPAKYRGDAFLAFHGSWNRSEKTGYKIVRVHFEAGKAVAISDFVRGFLKDGRAWGRPVDVNVAPDGALLFSDDGNGIIWRVSYMGD